jgi:hypothetical protein
MGVINKRLYIDDYVFQRKRSNDRRLYLHPQASGSYRQKYEQDDHAHL